MEDVGCSNIDVLNLTVGWSRGQVESPRALATFWCLALLTS
jgi:hypothetical protein